MKNHLISTYKEEQKEIFNKRFGIIFNGQDNLRPLEIENLSENFWQRTTPNDLLSQISECSSRHQGAFILVSYNAHFEKERFKLIPYTLCRLGKKDSKGYSGKVVVSPNGWGRYLKKQEVDVFDVYNPRQEVIQEQVEHAGGWHHYKGQVLFFKLNDKYTYPRSLIEPAYLHADLEHHMGFYNSTVKKGFENITFIRHLKFESQEQGSAFKDNIAQLCGVENTIGNTSGADLIAVQAVYNSMIASDRKKLEALFSELFSRYKEPTIQDWTIKQYALLKDGTIN